MRNKVRISDKEKTYQSSETGCEVRISYFSKDHQRRSFWGGDIEYVQGCSVCDYMKNVNLY
jgi:hypothetical protein